MAFRFLNPGPMVDGELELVTPEARWIKPLLDSCAHPQCADDPAASGTTRSRVGDFLRAAPLGRQAPDPSFARVPSYHFWMHLRRLDRNELNGRALPKWGDADPPVEMAGGIALRIGQTPELELYAGHIGYNVYLPARGNHYAERACRLLLPLARAHGMTRIWITCNPDNIPSRRTCERLGCQLAGVVPVPRTHPLYLRGDHEKCRYWLDV